MKFPRSQDNHTITLELTPLVDVTLLLLVFFMLTSTFAKDTGIELPEKTDSESFRDRTPTVEIDAANAIRLEGQHVTMIELDRFLSQAAEDQDPVLIQCDQASDVGKVFEVWNRCDELGVEAVRVATRVPADTTKD